MNPGWDHLEPERINDNSLLEKIFLLYQNFAAGDINEDFRQNIANSTSVQILDIPYCEIVRTRNLAFMQCPIA